MLKRTQSIQIITKPNINQKTDLDKNKSNGEDKETIYYKIPQHAESLPRPGKYEVNVDVSALNNTGYGEGTWYSDDNKLILEVGGSYEACEEVFSNATLKFPSGAKFNNLNLAFQYPQVNHGDPEPNPFEIVVWKDSFCKKCDNKYTDTIYEGNVLDIDEILFYY